MTENGAPSCRSASDRSIGSFCHEQTFAVADLKTGSGRNRSLERVRPSVFVCSAADRQLSVICHCKPYGLFWRSFYLQILQGAQVGRAPA